MPVVWQGLRSRMIILILIAFLFGLMVGLCVGSRGMCELDRKYWELLYREAVDE